jgi:hypothetical protein
MEKEIKTETIQPDEEDEQVYLNNVSIASFAASLSKTSSSTNEQQQQSAIVHAMDHQPSSAPVTDNLPPRNVAVTAAAAAPLSAHPLTAYYAQKRAENSKRLAMRAASMRDSNVSLALLKRRNCFKNTHVLSPTDKALHNLTKIVAELNNTLKNVSTGGFVAADWPRFLLILILFYLARILQQQTVT